MNPTVKNIFLNAELQHTRAGWRIIIFLLITMPISIGILFIFSPVLKFLPVFDNAAVKVLLGYAGITLGTWIVLRFIDRRPFEAVGLSLRSNVVRELGQGTLIGAGMMCFIFVVEYASGMVTIHFRELTTIEVLQTFGYSFVLYAAVGYGEELLFRGYLFQTFVEGTNKIIATLAVSLLFALAHAWNPDVSIFSLINIALAGIWLSIAYFKTQSLWLPAGLHFSWNFTQGFVFSFPVSGTTSITEHIGTAVVSGPEWLTGGAFGPEGGALATVILIAGTWYIYSSRSVFAAKGVWRIDQWREDRRQQHLAQQPVELQQ